MKFFVGGLMIVGSQFVLLKVGMATDVQDLKRGVVKITANVGGQNRVGTGFIVRIDDETAYIVTASHVVEGGSLIVHFYPKPDVPYPGNIKAMDGGNPKGLAVVMVRGSLPKGVRSLVLESNLMITGGEPVTLIGFPRAIGVPWAIASGIITGQKGVDLIIAGSAVQEGNSGGPILLNDRVVGVLTEIQRDFGYGVPSSITQVALKGWRVSLEPLIVDPISEADQERVKRSMVTVEFQEEITSLDGAPMVLIPQGPFLMGTGPGDREGYHFEKPEHLVTLNSFYIDRYEVTTQKYDKFLQKTARGKPKFWESGVSVSMGDRPIVGITWEDAKTYCEFYGKRLPTEAEWEKAARGTDGRKYPWGNDIPTLEYANFAKCCNFQSYKVLSPVGSLKKGRSPYGADDMAGNVGEWVADWYDENYYQRSPKENPQGPIIGKVKVIRGGSWMVGARNIRSANRYSINPRDKLDVVGFRCAQDLIQ